MKYITHIEFLDKTRKDAKTAHIKTSPVGDKDDAVKIGLISIERLIGPFQEVDLGEGGGREMAKANLKDGFHVLFQNDESAARCWIEEIAEETHN